MLPVTLRNLEPQVRGRMVKVDKEEGGLGRVVGKILNLSPERVDDVQAWLRRVASASRERSILSQDKEASSFNVPKPMGARAFEVVGIPLKKPGLYVVELESAILGASLLDPPRPMFVPTAALVTNLSVHFKWGRESSLVWVTRLDTGEPVKGASGHREELPGKSLVERNDRCGRDPENWNRTAFGRGSSPVRLQAQMTVITRRWELSSPSGEVFSSRPDSLTTCPLCTPAGTRGSNHGGYQLPYGSDVGSTMAHTIFDRTLLRAGETVHMKHILRRHTMSGFSLVPAARTPNLVSIEHEGSGQKYEFPLTWNANGICRDHLVHSEGSKAGELCRGSPGKE